MTITPVVEIVSSGSCFGNPGPGGWAALLRCDRGEQLLCGSDLQTTRNRMELMAAISAFEALTRPCDVTIATASEYVLRGLEGGIRKWRATNWKMGHRQIRNVDLWKRLDAARSPHTVACRWVHGHDRSPENERTDAEARLQSEAAQRAFAKQLSDESNRGGNDA